MGEMHYSIFPNERFVDLCLYQYGYEKCDKAHSFGPARRNHYVFHYIISGCGTLMADDAEGRTNTFQLRAGQGFMLFPGQVNTYIADSERPWEYTWAEFDGLRASEVVERAGLSLDRPVYDAGSRELSALMMNELLYISGHSSVEPFHLIGHLYLFLDYFMRSSASARSSRSGRLCDLYIKEAVSFIEENYSRNIGVEDIARHCNLNRSYFSRIFSEGVGRSPQEFLISYRMTKASELLRLTDLTIGEISSKVGYESQLHFSRAFRSVYGVSPRGWRNENRLLLS